MRKFKHELKNWIATEIDEYTFYISELLCNIPLKLIENSKDWVEIFDPKFKNGDVVKIIDEFGVSMILLTKVDVNTGFGFGLINDKWYKTKQITFKHITWQLASEEEWLEVLTKEAEKLYKVGDKIKRPDNFKYSKNGVLYKFGLNSLNGLNSFYYKGTQVMQDGVWAEVIKEETLDELAIRFRELFQISVNSIKDDYITFFNENKETIHRLSK